MNTKKGIVGITLAAIMIASIFAVTITPVASTGFTYIVGKNTLTAEGGTVDNTLQYRRGDTVYYRMIFKPTSEPCNLTSAKDVFPDGTEEDLLTTGSISLAQNEQVTWESNWTIPVDWPNDTITNNLRIEGLDCQSRFFASVASKTSFILADEGGPTAVATASPSCFEAGGTVITFDGSGSTYDTKPIVSYSWVFSDGSSGSSDDTAVTSRMVTDTITAALTVTDTLGFQDTTQVTVVPCSQCSIRIYGAFGEGAGDNTVEDPETGLPPENKPYSDPVGPFYPQNTQAPHNDFITFNPAIMDLQQGKEKVFKRMWYEKGWFIDHNQNGVWDVVTYDSEVMTLDEWLTIPAWKRPTLREWNSPNFRDYNPDADIYGPTINQEFTYMFVDEETMPIMIGNGSSVLIPMAHDPANPYRGLNSFDALPGDGIDRDYVMVESEETLGLDIDHDGAIEPMDGDTAELSGDETVVLALPEMTLYYGDILQFFDHKVELTGIFGGSATATFLVSDNEGGGSTKSTEVTMREGDVRYFYRAEETSPGQTFFLRVITISWPDGPVRVQVGRMFGQTYANIGANPYRSQKAFMVDDVFYNVVAIKAEDNCIKYITFKQMLPKLPVKFFDKHLTCWAPGETLPEMPPFNMNHGILIDVQHTWTIPYSQQDKIGTKVPRPPLEIDYIAESIEYRNKGELKEIYNETGEGASHWEGWNLEWFWTLPWQYTEFRLPKDDRYLVTLSWIADESEFVLWDSDPNGPVANCTGGRLKFWFEDCSGPLYIDRATSSIRMYGTFGEGPGDFGTIDPGTGLAPENKPYTDPVGPFDPENEQAPVKDFMTFNPAIMDYNQGYPELLYYECPGYMVQQGKEKVFKRMWYEKSWFMDHNQNGVWDVVTIDGGVITLDEWLAIPAWERPEIRVWNSPPDWISNADIYGPAIKQEFTYMFLDEETMPIIIGNGSSVLIPLASWEQGNGLDSFDADGDGVRDAVLVESEQTVGIDIDGDGVLEPMDSDFNELSGNESVVLRLENKFMHLGDVIQLFDHRVTLIDVQSTGTDYRAVFYVCDNEGDGSQRCTENVVMNMNDVRTFHRGRPGNPAEKPVFYLRLITADAIDNTAIVEIGRMFGQTQANIEANPYRSQKAFVVDEVFYNVVAIKAEDNCIKYVTFRQQLPKVPINLFGKDLKCWAPGEILPEMPPFNEEHEILIDLQPAWDRPYSQEDKIGIKEPRPPLEIYYTEEDIEPRFKGALKEIYNQTVSDEEYWNEEWFWTKPWQYTAFVLPEGQLYLMTLAWYAPESEITIWNHDPNGPIDYYTGERVKFWYDAADSTDIYVNRVGANPPSPTIWEYYDRAANGGDGDGEIDLQELLNAILDYSDEFYPFGINGMFDKEDLCDYLLAFIDQESDYHYVPPSSTINEYYDLPSNGGDGDGRIDPQELANAIRNCLDEGYPFGPSGMFSYSDLLAYIEDYIELECSPTENHPPNPPTNLAQLKSDSKTVIPVGDTTDERTVIFKGNVSDTDGDKIKLQVELRRLDEYGGQFDETKGGLKGSVLVESGSEAVAYAYGLIDADYHWRARAVDEHGQPSEWVDFGDNDISDADFSVKVTYNPKLSIPVYAPLLQTAHKGTTLTYIINVINEGGITDTIDLSTSDTLNWNLQLSKNLVTLASGESTDIYLNVTIEENDFDTITITGTSEGNTSKTSSCTAYVHNMQYGYGLFAASLQFSNKDTEEHTLTFDVPDYVKISDKTITLSPSGTEQINVVFDPKPSESNLNTIYVDVTDITSGWGARIPIEFISTDEIIATNYEMAKDSYSFQNWGIVLPIGDFEVLGNCYGMSETSILYFRNIIALPNNKPNTYSLTKDEAKWKIRYHQWWWNNWIAGAKILFSEIDNEKEYNELEENINNGKTMILATKGHAVVAYKIIRQADKSYILVYENEQPYDISNNNFYLAFPYATYNLTSHEFNYENDIKFLVKEAKKHPFEYVILSVECPVNVTITDQYNRIISDNGTNEILNATIISSNGTKIFYLPANLTYNVDVCAYDVGNFTLTKMAPITNEIAVINAFDNTSITNKTKATLEIRPNELNQTMNIDYNGDGVIDEVKNPDVNETITVSSPEDIFDTDSPKNPYPSIMGNHTGTIKPNHTVIASKLYTYPCPGTGGHTEYAEIRNATWNATAFWKGYRDDWHNITFDKTVVLLENKTYTYTIRTGSYPQIIHEQNHTTLDGSFINCTKFTDANGKTYTNWIPAIRLH